MHLLIIEDDRRSRELLTALLERDGHTMVVEADGARGHARALAERFDLILCDIELPGMDGFAVCRALRAEGIRIPILAVTARTAPNDRLVGEQAGFTSYLAKPIRVSALREALRASVRQVVTAPPPVASSALASTGSGCQYRSMRSVPPSATSTCPGGSLWIPRNAVPSPGTYCSARYASTAARSISRDT